MTLRKAWVRYTTKEAEATGFEPFLARVGLDTDPDSLSYSTESDIPAIIGIATGIKQDRIKVLDVSYDPSKDELS